MATQAWIKGDTLTTSRTLIVQRRSRRGFGNSIGRLEMVRRRRRRVLVMLVLVLEWELVLQLVRILD